MRRMDTNDDRIHIRISPRDRIAVSAETKRKLVYFATRAPSGHNSQPWKFRFSDNCIEIHPDFERSLPVVDPNHRELFVSLGCASENLTIAASHFDLQPSVCVDCNSPSPVIRVNLEFAGPIPEDPLHSVIEKRQTNRRVYDGRRLTPHQLNRLKIVSPNEGVSIDFFERGSHDFEKIKGRITAANEIQMENNEFKTELLDWIRYNRSQVADHMDGLTHRVMDAPAMPTFFGRWLMGRFLNPEAQAISDLKKIESSSHLVVLSTFSNDTRHWIALGQSLQRLLLNLTSLGIAAAYMNPPCEVRETSRQLAELIDRRNPMIVLRIGFAKDANSSPRRPVEDVVLS